LFCGTFTRRRRRDFKRFSVTFCYFFFSFIHPFLCMCLFFYPLIVGTRCRDTTQKPRFSQIGFLSFAGFRPIFSSLLYFFNNISVSALHLSSVFSFSLTFTLHLSYCNVKVSMSVLTLGQGFFFVFINWKHLLGNYWLQFYYSKKREDIFYQSSMTSTF